MTKLQKAVVSWLKKYVPVKKTKFAHTHVVQYFSAGRALDALMKVVSSIWTSLQSPELHSGLALVNGEVKGGVWAEAGVQGAGHRPDAGADAPQDVPQVRILRSVFFCNFSRAKKIPVADKKKKKEDTDGEVNWEVLASGTGTPRLKWSECFICRQVCLLPHRQEEGRVRETRRRRKSRGRRGRRRRGGSGWRCTMTRYTTRKEKLEKILPEQLFEGSSND